LTGVPLLFISSRIVVQGDAAATAANIIAHRSLFQLRIAMDLLGGMCYVVVTALFYVLFRAVNRSVSLTPAFFSLVGCGIGAIGNAFEVGPLMLLGGAPYLRAFTTEQLQGLSYTFIRLHQQTFNIGLVFFGVYCLLIGYLIVKSG